MVTILAVVTAISLVLTIALGVVVVRLLSAERRRSEARIALLAQMAAVDAPADALLADGIESEQYDRFENLGHADRDRIKVQAADLFAVRQQHSAWPWRLGVVGALALLAVTVGLSVRVILSETPARPQTGTNTGIATTGQPASMGLLELLSLKHAQQGDTLTITGLVQNPKDGTPLTKVTATAFLFAADGTFLASGRAPLDFTLLRPGDESGFVINVPVAGTVARYRIGFRSEDGRIIGHVDRRGGPSMARLVNGS